MIPFMEIVFFMTQSTMHQEMYGLAVAKDWLNSIPFETRLCITSMMNAIQTVYLPTSFIPWKLTIGRRPFGWLHIMAAFAPIGWHPEHSNITARKMVWRIISFIPLKKIIMEISGSAAMPGSQLMTLGQKH